MPLELLQALAAAGAAADRAARAEGGEGGEGEEREEGGEAEEGEEGEEGEEPLAVGAEELELLLCTLQQRLRPLLASEEADAALVEGGAPADGDVRRVYVACYRQGLRAVLSEAIAWAEGLLGGAEEGEEGEEGEAGARKE